MLFESSKSFWHILVHTILNNHKTPDTSNMDFFGWTNTEYIMILYYTTFLQKITAAENFWYHIQDKFSHFATEWIFFYLKKVREKACDFSSFLKNPFCTHVCIIEIPFSHERFCSIAKYVHISTYKYHSVAYVHHGHVFFFSHLCRVFFNVPCTISSNEIV